MLTDHDTSAMENEADRTTPTITSYSSYLQTTVSTII